MGVVDVKEPAPLAEEGWFNSRWRPAMAWLWFAVSAADFLVFPVLNAAAAGAKLIPYAPWDPITLKGGGLFHIAMGAVVGVAVWQRSNEKLAIYGAAYGRPDNAPGRFRGYGAATDDTTTPGADGARSSRAD